MTLSGALRDPPLVAALVLTGLALFFGGGAGDGSLWWLGGGAAVAIVVALATRGLPRGLVTLAPFALLVAWLAASISWSWLPDRSWDYADRALVYLLFAALGLWLSGRTRELALGLAPRLRLARRACPHVLARRAGDGRRRGHGVPGAFRRPARARRDARRGRSAGSGRRRRGVRAAGDHEGRADHV